MEFMDEFLFAVGIVHGDAAKKDHFMEEVKIKG